MTKAEIREMIAAATAEYQKNGGVIKKGRTRAYKNITWPADRAKSSVANRGRQYDMLRRAGSGV